jgi:hypothetical protein
MQMPDKDHKKNNIEIGRLCFSFFVLGAQVLIAALAAGGCADGIAGIAMQAYFHVE